VLKNWIDFLTVVLWMVLVLIYLPLVIRDGKNFGYYSAWLVYLAVAIGVANLVLSRHAYLIS
jgi:hypothetical protein